MINIRVGNAYAWIKSGDALCVTTNGVVMANGKAVMGAGNAKVAKLAFPGIDLKLAEYLKKYGNRVFNLGVYNYKGLPVRLLSFPTKFDWKDKSSLSLIEQSARQLSELIAKLGLQCVYLPAPGCSNGGLKWREVSAKLDGLTEGVTVYSERSDLFR